jgi:hypothetical protein
MKKYEQLESQIEELQKEVERLKQEEAEQVDLSTCVIGQLVQLRNGDFEYYEFKDGAGFYVISGGDAYDVVKVFPAEIPVPMGFNPTYAKKVLKGDVSALESSFNFADTPQGDKYWRDIYEGRTNLFLGDVILIQKWIIQSP